MQKLSRPKPWLFMFDIDDTLVKRGPKLKTHEGFVRWQRTLKAVFDVNIEITPSSKYNGWVDWQIGWDYCYLFTLRKKITPENFPCLGKNYINKL
jgi:hypothetical protein